VQWRTALRTEATSAGTQAVAAVGAKARLGQALEAGRLPGTSLRRSTP